MSNERFCELAHKSLAKEAQPPEEAELQALLAENSELKREFEEMTVEAKAAREILPLLEDISNPQGSIPPPPMERLKEAVGDVFRQRREAKDDPWDLLAKLEKWASGQTGSERDRIATLISNLRRFLFAARSRASTLPQALASAEEFEFSERWPSEHWRPTEFEDRLRHLETRIRKIEGLAHESEQELNSVLKQLWLKREMSERQRTIEKPKPSRPE